MYLYSRFLIGALLKCMHYKVRYKHKMTILCQISNPDYKSTQTLCQIIWGWPSPIAESLYLVCTLRFAGLENVVMMKGLVETHWSGWLGNRWHFNREFKISAVANLNNHHPNLNIIYSQSFWQEFRTRTIMALLNWHITRRSHICPFTSFWDFVRGALFPCRGTRDCDPVTEFCLPVLCSSSISI